MQAREVHDEIEPLIVELTDLCEELHVLRAEREEMQTELVVARRWVELLAREVEQTRAELARAQREAAST